MSEIDKENRNSKKPLTPSRLKPTSNAFVSSYHHNSVAVETARPSQEPTPKEGLTVSRTPLSPSLSSSSTSSSSTNSNYDLIEAPATSDEPKLNQLEFKFFYEFYKLKETPQDKRLCRQYQADYQNTFDKLNLKSGCMRLLLNPVLVEFNANNAAAVEPTAIIEFCFKFTIDYLRNTLVPKINPSHASDADIHVDAAPEELSNFEGCYFNLVNDLFTGKESLVDQLVDIQSFHAAKSKLHGLIKQKAQLFLDQQNKTLKMIELNEKLGTNVSIVDFDLRKMFCSIIISI